MPPKQVYGRRRPVKAAATFSKLISPDKDATTDHGTEKVISKLPPGVKRSNVQALEDKLATMRLEDDKESMLGSAKCTDGPIADGVAEKRSEAKNIILEESTHGSVSKSSDATTNKDIQTPKKNFKTQKKDKTRIPLKDKKATPVTKNNRVDTTSHEQTTVPTKATQKQSTSPAPSSSLSNRKSKAIPTPKRSSTPPMALPLTLQPLPGPGHVTPLKPENIYTKYVSSLLNQTYGKNIVAFDEWSSALELHFTVSKIAEASYSEVYRLSTRNPVLGSSHESVLKLIALKTPPNAPLPTFPQGRKARGSTRQPSDQLEIWKEKEKWKSDVNDVHSEVKLLQNLNQIPGFTNFREVVVLQGRPTTLFSNAWKAWNKTRARGKKSEFPDPSKRSSYEDTQLWAVVEMQDAGTDCEKVMESGGVSTVWEVWDIFWGVCLSVAKAEETCKFEHRDLHLENICIRSSRSPSKDDLTLPIIKDPLRRKLGFSGLDTTVIDYTLSRADIIPKDGPSHPYSSSIAIKEEVAYLDLEKDLSLFEGDASEEYQYEIYRYMRGVALYNNPLKFSPPTTGMLNTPPRSPPGTAQHIRFDDTGNSDTCARPSPLESSTDQVCAPSPEVWKKFHPRTNLVWAHFILAKLLQHLEGGDPTVLSPKQVMRNVEAKPSETGKVVRKAGKLFAVLKKVNELLSPETLRRTGSLEGVKELVVLALEQRWLRIEDVTGV